MLGWSTLWCLTSIVDWRRLIASVYHMLMKAAGRPETGLWIVVVTGDIHRLNTDLCA